MATEMGYSTWSAAGGLRWTDLVSEKSAIATSATDGKLYALATETSVDGYRVEPAISFAGGSYSILLEIWFSIVSGGAYNLYVYYRSGDSDSEISSASWTALDEVSLNNPKNAVCRLNNVTKKSARFHQIKWGTDVAGEFFSINKVEFVYQSESRW
jgi:hypothetical protein